MFSKWYYHIFSISLFAKWWPPGRALCHFQGWVGSHHQCRWRGRWPPGCDGWGDPFAHRDLGEIEWLLLTWFYTYIYITKVKNERCESAEHVMLMQHEENTVKITASMQDFRISGIVCATVLQEHGIAHTWSAWRFSFVVPVLWFWPMATPVYIFIWSPAANVRRAQVTKPFVAQMCPWNPCPPRWMGRHSHCPREPRKRGLYPFGHGMMSPSHGWFLGWSMFFLGWLPHSSWWSWWFILIFLRFELLRKHEMTDEMRDRCWPRLSQPDVQTNCQLVWVHGGSRDSFNQFSPPIVRLWRLERSLLFLCAKDLRIATNSEGDARLTNMGLGKLVHVPWTCGFLKHQHKNNGSWSWVKRTWNWCFKHHQPMVAHIVLQKDDGQVMLKRHILPLIRCLWWSWSSRASFDCSVDPP